MMIDVGQGKNGEGWCDSNSSNHKNKEHSCWCSRAHGVPPWEAAFLATDKAWITHVRKFGRKWRDKLSLFWTTLKCQLSVCCLITISQRVETWPTTSSQEERNEMGSGQVFPKQRRDVHMSQRSEHLTRALLPSSAECERERPPLSSLLVWDFLGLFVCWFVLLFAISSPLMILHPGFTRTNKEADRVVWSSWLPPAVPSWRKN